MLDYVLQYESDSVKRIGSGYRSKEHESLAISDKGFFWHSNGVGGKTALDYLMAVRNYDFVSAVCHLINETPFEKGDKPYAKKQERSPPKSYMEQSDVTTATNKSAISTDGISTIITTPTASPTPLPSSQNESKSKPQTITLPRRNKDNYQVIAYLQNRGIDRDVIMDCINRGVLYQSALHHNAVFLGKDENGKTRFAAMRGTKGDFKCDAEGSDKKYGFVIPPKNCGINDALENQLNGVNLQSQTVMIFESPIDCLSHQTLCKHGDIPDFDGWRLSLGGTSGIALMSFLERYPNINHCIIATDNDETGNTFAERLANKLTIPTERVHPTQGKDWNDAVLLALKAMRAVTSSEHANEHASL